MRKHKPLVRNDHRAPRDLSTGLHQSKREKRGGKGRVNERYDDESYAIMAARGPLSITVIVRADDIRGGNSLTSLMDWLLNLAVVCFFFLCGVCCAFFLSLSNSVLLSVDEMRQDRRSSDSEAK